MDFQEKLFLTAFLILAVAIDGTRADAMVTGTVFCDQCKDGERSLFDYPVNGAKVTMTCADSNGQVMMSREEKTNWFGGYSMRFDGTPDLNGCSAHVSGSGEGSMGCGEAAGPPQNLRLMFRMFDMEMYTVDPLLAQPAKPMEHCSSRSSVTQQPKSPPPPFKLPPMPRLPPLPSLPPLPPMPPLPPPIFPEASACTHDKWTMPEYKCYWRGVNPETKVAVAFGMVAARRYGTDMNLWNGLQGRGDPYRTLLREGVTALLNSYNSLQFSYHPLGVVQHMDIALMGSTRSVLLTALRFKRANSGAGNVTCKFTSCK
ncbi:pollen Ole e I family allergen [Senna tora]|uniref:Pollen Ole e I family allergen n=1 Tax=Senna tora TaxID=362788 RepID=A0A834XAU4_9FABA|nr:pollen Ole e I family allergen [Senna tora]